MFVFIFSIYNQKFSSLSNDSPVIADSKIKLIFGIKFKKFYQFVLLQRFYTKNYLLLSIDRKKIFKVSSTSPTLHTGPRKKLKFVQPLEYIFYSQMLNIFNVLTSFKFKLLLLLISQNCVTGSSKNIFCSWLLLFSKVTVKILLNLLFKYFFLFINI